MIKSHLALLTTHPLCCIPFSALKTMSTVESAKNSETSKNLPFIDFNLFILVLIRVLYTILFKTGKCEGVG